MRRIVYESKDTWSAKRRIASTAESIGHEAAFLPAVRIFGHA